MVGPLAQLTRRIDLETHVSTFTKLRHRRGRCPLADHGSPDSFSISEPTDGKAYWYCFACGEGGDLVDFECRRLGIPVSAALMVLRATYGVDTGRVLSEAEREAELARQRERKAVLEQERMNAITAHTRLEEAAERIADDALRACPADPWGNAAVAEAMMLTIEAVHRSLVNLRERHGPRPASIPLAERRRLAWTPARIQACLEDWRSSI